MGNKNKTPISRVSFAEKTLKNRELNTASWATWATYGKPEQTMICTYNNNNNNVCISTPLLSKL